MKVVEKDHDYNLYLIKSGAGKLRKNSLNSAQPTLHSTRGAIH